jgi:hypothetical protein
VRKTEVSAAVKNAGRTLKPESAGALGMISCAFIRDGNPMRSIWKRNINKYERIVNNFDSNLCK